MRREATSDAPSVTQVEIYRAMVPAKRIAVGCGLHDFAHEMLTAHLRRLHPEKTEREILVEVARRFLGDAARVL